MFTIFAGPVFSETDAPTMLSFFLLWFLPYVLMLIALGLLMYDCFKKKLRPVTIIFVIITTVLYLIYKTRGIL